MVLEVARRSWAREDRKEEKGDKKVLVLS